MGIKAYSLLETTLNTRELGGYLAADGRYTKYNALIRSDMQKYPSEKDIQFLLDRKISTIIDLRGRQEVRQCASKLQGLGGFTYFNVPIEEGSGIPESVAAVPQSYMNIACAKNMKDVFRHIAYAEDGVLFHCSAGKDRTGVVSAILLLLAGVGKEDIVANYMLTKECNKERFRLIKTNFPNIDINIVIPQEMYMIRFLELFMSKFGDAAAYLESIGISAEEQMQIKRKLL